MIKVDNIYEVFSALHTHNKYPITVSCYKHYIIGYTDYTAIFLYFINRIFKVRYETYPVNYPEHKQNEKQIIEKHKNNYLTLL